MNTAIPEYLKKAQATSTDESATPSLKYLSFNLNNQFKLKLGAEDKKLGSFVRIVILAIDPPKNFVNGRAYWPGDFDSSNGEAPVCASPDGVTHYDYVETPQATNCRQCQWAALGSSGKGKGTQCKSFKMIYFVFFGEETGGVGALRVPVTSLKNLATYRWSVREMGVPIAGIVTKITFDPDSEYTKLLFSSDGFLTEDKFKTTSKLASSAEIAQLINSQVVQIPHEIKGVSELPKNAAPAPSEKPAIDLDSFFDDAPTKPAASPSAADQFLSKIHLTKNIGELKDLVALLSNKHGLLAYATPQEKNVLKAAAQEKRLSFIAPMQTTTSPTPDRQIRTKIELVQELARLRAFGTTIESIAGQNFVNRASELNMVLWNSDEHSTSKDGFPAFAQDGSFKKRRGLKTANRVPPESLDDQFVKDEPSAATESTPVSEGIGDIMDMLDEL